MYKYLQFVLFLLIVISCQKNSTDDTSNGMPYEEKPYRVRLKKATYTNHSNNTITHHEYTYNDNGSLILRSYFINGELNHQVKYEYSYDKLQKSYSVLNNIEFDTTFYYYPDSLIDKNINGKGVIYFEDNKVSTGHYQYFDSVLMNGFFSELSYDWDGEKSVSRNSKNIRCVNGVWDTIIMQNETFFNVEIREPHDIYPLGSGYLGNKYIEDLEPYSDNFETLYDYPLSYTVHETDTAFFEYYYDFE